MSKKVITYMIILAVIISSHILTWADVQDYRDIVFKDSDDDPVLKPTAQFSITHKETVYKSPAGIDLNSNSMVVNATVGDTVTVADLSHSNRGKSLKAWDFQYTRPDGKNQFITTQAFQKSYTLDVVGIYTFSLCVRDTIENEAWTSYWGNWSDNGNHRVVGNNPGRDASDPSDDFDGYWYFTRIVIEVVNNPPTAEFTIEYKGEDVTDNQGSPVTIDETNKAIILKDNSKPFSAVEPIIGRKWYYWNTASGWSEISGSENKTTVNITDMDANISGSGINKAFKLVCTSSTGGHDYALHTGYFKKGIPTYYGYIVYYKDVDTELDIKSPKMVTVDYPGTYTENALYPTPANGTLLTASPANIVLTKTAPQAEFTFYYKFTVSPEPPTSNPPTAILKLPKEVMAGVPVKADGGESWSNNPGGYIADYVFGYEGANLISDNGSNVRVWYPITGIYTVSLEVIDENGDTDWVEEEIKVIPPTPTAIMTVGGNLKENRKVALDGSGSISPQYYPIDHTKTKWEITQVSGGAYTGENLLRNGNAESSDASGALSGWNTWAQNPSVTTFTKRTGDQWVISGSSSFQIFTQANQNYAATYYQDVNAAGGISYTFSGKVGAHRCIGFFYVEAYDSSWKSLGAWATDRVTNNAVVQNLAVNFVAPANTEYLRTNIVKEWTTDDPNGWGAYVFADDLVLAPAFPAVNIKENLLTNGNAEKYDASGVLWGWNSWAPNPSAVNITKRVGDQFVINGGSSFEINTLPGRNYLATYYQDVPAVGGIRYTFTGKMATHRCHGYVYITAYDSAWNAIGYYVTNGVNYIPTPQNISVSFTPPANTKILRVQIVKNESFPDPGGYNEYVFADDLVLTAPEVKDTLFKKAGTYKAKLTVTNTYGLSASTEQTITIIQDLPPVAKLYLPTPAGSIYKVYRDPDDSNYATFQIFNQSYSTDGDTINKAVMMYCYDSDNDGDYKDEQWYYSKDGTTWASNGMNYINTVSSFNMFGAATSNISTFTLKTKEVGRYHYAIRVMETIPTADTIPEFITESDYRRDDDF